METALQTNNMMLAHVTRLDDNGNPLWVECEKNKQRFCVAESAVCLLPYDVGSKVVCQLIDDQVVITHHLIDKRFGPRLRCFYYSKESKSLAIAIGESKLELNADGTINLRNTKGAAVQLQDNTVLLKGGEIEVNADEDLKLFSNSGFVRVN